VQAARLRSVSILGVASAAERHRTFTILCIGGNGRATDGHHPGPFAPGKPHTLRENFEMQLPTRFVFAAIAMALLNGTAGAASDDHPAIKRALGHLQAQSTAQTLSADAAADTFKAHDVVVDPNGDEHVRFHRQHRGLPVIGGDIVVHSDSRGRFARASRTMPEALRLDTNARFDDATAVQYAQSLFAGQADGNAKSALVVYARGPQPVLAYDVTVSGTGREGTPSVMHHIVDANSLQLLDRYDEIMTSTASGTGDTLLSGAVQITTDSQANGTFAMRDPSRSNNYTTSLKNRTTGTGAIFTDADNIWGNFSTSSTVTVGADAHYGLQLTWDYYKSTFGRNGIDGSGSTTYSRVHFGRNYANAFWDDACFCMSYGDGNGSSVQPLVAIDVAGHEMSHGVTSRTAGLIYSGESGGLNEATSDIFGTMVEFYANNPKNPPNYLIGERIYTANNGNATPTTALRYMFKPSLDGASPDCYSSSLGSLNVHYSSGVANHFYYLLAQGAVVPAGFNLSPSQLVCNGNTSIAGIGRDAAAKIWYRALTVYMTSNTNYAAARAATLSAAADLFGAGSSQRNAVAAAWSAVSVN
jgi:zinc metalloprotease ZmpA